jgi:hypothetical protein
VLTVDQAGGGGEPSGGKTSVVSVPHMSGCLPGEAGHWIRCISPTCRGYYCDTCGAPRPSPWPRCVWKGKCSEEPELKTQPAISPRSGVERQPGGGGCSSPKRLSLATITEEPSESLEDTREERFDTLTRHDVASEKGTSLEARQLAAEQTLQDIESVTRQT